MSSLAGNALVAKNRRNLRPFFVSKLKLLLDDEKYHQAIHWSESGTAVVITDVKTFQRLVLDPSREETGLFKTRKFESFVRQLNLHGFRKVKVWVNGKFADPTKNMIFKHLNFKRDKPELMHLVCRTNYLPPRMKNKTSTQLPSANPSKCISSEAAKSAEIENSETLNFSPNRDGSECNHWHNSPLEVSSSNKALEAYMCETFQEEQHAAAQLLLNFQDLATSLSYTNVLEWQLSPAPMSFEPTCCPLPTFYATM